MNNQIDTRIHPQQNIDQLPWKKRYNWASTLFLTITPVLALISAPIYFYHYGLSLEIAIAFIVYINLTGTGITAGYHRLFSHLTYQAKPWLKAWFLFFGAGAWESSALKWASDHRRHHRHADTEDDPYNINAGFFFAHFHWLLLKDDSKYVDRFEKDLLADPMVVFQHKYYIPIAIFSGFIVPLIFGFIIGDPWGGFLIVGLLRMVVNQHFTFLINSAAHTFGKQTYSDKITARDNGLLAFFTYGEGYHNFHHKFQADYRNGVKWYQWDPTKWVIRVFQFLGCAFNLRRVSSDDILRATIQQQERKLLTFGAPAERLKALKEHIEQAQIKFKHLAADYQARKLNMQKQSKQKLLLLKAELKMAKIEFRKSVRQWSVYHRTYLSLGPKLAAR